MTPADADLSQDFIDVFKRERVALALSEVAREVGLGQLSVKLIISRAQMARSTFYALFDSRENAVAFSIDLGNQRLRSAVERAVSPAEPPRERVEAVIAALLSAAEKDPYLAELCLVHGRCTDSGIVLFDPDLVELLAGVIRAIRRRGPQPGPHTENLVALGILALVTGRLRRGGAESLNGLGPELTKVVLGTFLGPDAVATTV